MNEKQFATIKAYLSLILACNLAIFFFSAFSFSDNSIYYVVESIFMFGVIFILVINGLYQFAAKGAEF